MKITRVLPRIVRRDMGGRVWNPRTRWQEKVMVLVFLEDDSGHLGVGEAWNTAARGLGGRVDERARPAAVCAATDVVLMMVPLPCPRNHGTAARQVAKTERRLRSISSS